MSGTEGREPQGEEKALVEGAEAASEVLHPAIPPVGAAIVVEADARLNQPSETEAELKELVESNEAAGTGTDDTPDE